MGFGKIFRSLVDISRNLIFVEFSRILRLVESGRFLRRGVDISRFSRFQFGVRVVGYKALLLIIGGGK
jgi:hypothetical protein